MEINRTKTEELYGLTLDEIIKLNRKNFRKYNIKKFFCKPYNVIKSTILCIRFPFLYPRNRWTGKHYNNWKLNKYHQKKWNDAYVWKEDNWIVKSKKIALKIKIADYLNSFLGIFHCLPSYTELDSMPTAWRKLFGIQMCKEIKKALLEEGRKKLYEYRILDIKSKFGALRWYDSYGNREVDNIIHKYEYISNFTCCFCGRTAKYRTTGWIENYCEHCISEKDKETAKEFYSDIPFYGWTNGEYYKKHKNDDKEDSE